MSDSFDLLERGQQLISQRRASEAVVILEKACELEPKKGSVREALARALFNSGATGRAREEFQAAVDLNPADDYAYFGLALCVERLGNRKKAAGLLRIALAMRPNSENYQRALRRVSL